MSDLLATQRAFAAALREPGALEHLAPRLAGDAELAARRFAVYRANAQATAARALAAAYPVIRAVVGDAFFDGLARAYLETFPSTSGNLDEFGAELARFAADFEPTRTLAYLPDLARLEWAVHRAYGAADAPPFDPASLAAVAGDPGGLRFEWAPGVAVVASTWPIVRVWSLHQPGQDGGFEVDWSVAEAALVSRAGWRVAVDVLASGEAAFVAASLGGADFAASAEAALEASAETDVGALLGRVLAAGAVAGFTISKD